MNNNRCVICGEIIPEGLQLCPNCFAVGQKPKEKILIEMDINAVPSELMAKAMLRLIENFCNQYGKTIGKRANGKYDIVNANEEWFIANSPVIPNELAVEIINKLAKKEFGRKRGL